MDSADAELQTLANTITETRTRVTTLALGLEEAKREDAAGALFEAERALATALRQLQVTRTRLR